MIQEVPQDVLLVTADAATTRLVLECLAAKGVRGTVAGSPKAVAQRMDQRLWDLVIADLDMGGEAVVKVIRQVRPSYPDTPIVAVSSEDSAGAAVSAMREGCADYRVKPLDRAAVRALLEEFLPAHAVPMAAADSGPGRCLYRIAGRSPRLLEAIALAEKAAPTSLPVLITGESGTGKELISYLVHRASRRAQGPYIRVNCAALSESLLESELFGHERGAFTGAVAQRKGRFERAHGGTLLLDEISETGPRLQAELLRVLEQQDFERVGGSDLISVSVRILSTTNRDLARDVQEGRFRADLYWRLCGLRIDVPPLRDRREDIPVLVWHFVNQFAREVHRPITQLDPEMTDLLLRYHWPGNVRQLRNIVRTALIVGGGPVLSLAGVPWMVAQLSAAGDPSAHAAGDPSAHAAGDPSAHAAGDPSAHAAGAPPSPGLTLRLKDLERRAILEAMRLSRHHQVRAARLLGITDRTLREKLRRYRQEEAEMENREPGSGNREPATEDWGHALLAPCGFPDPEPQIPIPESRIPNPVFALKEAPHA
jgi:DNA-binding NtrC family response regulator